MTYSMTVVGLAFLIRSLYSDENHSKVYTIPAVLHYIGSALAITVGVTVKSISLQDCFTKLKSSLYLNVYCKTRKTRISLIFVKNQ